MDEQVVSRSSSCSPHSPADTFFSAAGQLVLEFMSCDVPEEWLLANYSAWAVRSSLPAGSDMSMQGNAPSLPAKRRGRKPGPCSDGPSIRHVEAERQRRDRLNRQFCDLRAAVPTVSRMDKASLLADVIAYITELRGRVEWLEAEAKQAAAARKAFSNAFGLEEKLEVRMVEREAATLRLDLSVQHVCVSHVGALTVHDSVVDVPAALQDKGYLRAALLHRLQES